jgi:hypothetical protein
MSEGLLISSRGRVISYLALLLVVLTRAADVVVLARVRAHYLIGCECSLCKGRAYVDL